MKNGISQNFRVPLNSLSSVKTAKSSLARGHMEGGGRLGVPGVGTLDPRHGLGGPYTRKNSIAFGKSTSQRIYPKQHTPKKS